MSLEAYKVIHIIAIFGLFIAFGAAGGSEKRVRWANIMHGICLLVILIAGFGMLARLGIVGGKFPGWVWGKLAIWLSLGGMLTVVRRKLLPAPAWMAILLALGGAAAWLGIMH